MQYKKGLTRQTLRSVLYPVYQAQYDKGEIARWEHTEIILMKIYKDTFLYPRFAEHAINTHLIENISKQTIVSALVTGSSLNDLLEMDEEARYSLSN